MHAASLCYNYAILRFEQERIEETARLWGWAVVLKLNVGMYSEPAGDFGWMWRSP